MAFVFSKLSAKSKRAAFAKMDRARAGSKGGGKPGSSVGGKTSSSAAGSGSAAARVANATSGQRTAQHLDASGRVIGRISREDAAARMFGTRGAAARMAKANKKRKTR